MRPEKTPRVRSFLAAIKTYPSVAKAARAAGIARNRHYRRYKDPEQEAYRRAFDAAWETGCARLESEAVAIEEAAYQRALKGTLRPQYWKGKVCGAVREWPESTVQFLLRGAMPDRYREQLAVKHSGNLNIITERLIEARKRVQPAAAE